MANGHSVSVWEDDKALKIHGGDVTQQHKCTNASESHTHNGRFYVMYILPQ